MCASACVCVCGLWGDKLIYNWRAPPKNVILWSKKPPGTSTSDRPPTSMCSSNSSVPRRLMVGRTKELPRPTEIGLHYPAIYLHLWNTYRYLQENLLSSLQGKCIPNEPKKKQETPTDPNANHVKETQVRATRIKCRCGVWSEVESVECGV